MLSLSIQEFTMRSPLEAYTSSPDINRWRFQPFRDINPAYERRHER